MNGLVRKAFAASFLLAACSVLDRSGSGPADAGVAQNPDAGLATKPASLVDAGASPEAATPKPPEPPKPCPEEMALIDDRFCIDKWEGSLVDEQGQPHSPFHRLKAKVVKAQSKPGVVPQAHVSHDQADAACKLAGKRLCTSQQWIDACGGKGKYKRPYPYGEKRKKKACNTYQPLHPTSMLWGNPRDDSVSLNDPRLNQQKNTVAKTGAHEECVTPEGVYDMHGNVMEWTRGAKPLPYLLGGYYLDGERHGKGCFYVTDGHDTQYHDMTTGFRCCKKPDEQALGEHLKTRAAAEPPKPKRKARPDGQIPRDPEGMRGFFDAMGKLPEVKPSAYASESAECPVDMVHISGERCTEPVQRCLGWMPPRGGKTRDISCVEFKTPATCKGRRSKMDYCIDRYEFQPEGYDYPLTHVNWSEAKILCTKMGKRLCTENEWEFACEGPESLPYPYGFVRDGKRCNHDFPEWDLVTSPDNFIDRRVARDALKECVSPFGVYNLVGNVDEWTTRTANQPPRRSILRGGWWLQGRNRCRAATDNHSEIYAGMQTGFRCCKESR